MKRSRRAPRRAAAKPRASKRSVVAKASLSQSPKANRRRPEKTVSRALRDVERAHETVSARSAELIAVVHRLWDEATEIEHATVVRELGERFVLRDVAALRDAFGQAPTGSLPETIERLRNLPAALLDWIEDRFGIVQHLEHGRELDVPQSALTAFTFEKGPPPADLPLVRLLVVTPGWKRRGTIITRPTAEWASPAR